MDDITTSKPFTGDLESTSVEVGRDRSVARSMRLHTGRTLAGASLVSLRRCLRKSIIPSAESSAVTHFTTRATSIEMVPGPQAKSSTAVVLREMAIGQCEDTAPTAASRMARAAG
jgi:hypothetical protein